MTDTPPAKIEPWIRRLALDTVDYIIRHLIVDRDDEKYDLTDHVALRLHFSIAAHAPKQEPVTHHPGVIETQELQNTYIKEASVPGSKPRFDDIYYDGVAWLDKLDGT